MSNILTKHNYSWRHIITDRNGYDNEEPLAEETDNEHDINNFDQNVQAYFILDDSCIKPYGIKFVEADDIYANESSNPIL